MSSGRQWSEGGPIARADVRVLLTDAQLRELPSSEVLGYLQSAPARELTAEDLRVELRRRDVDRLLAAQARAIAALRRAALALTIVAVVVAIAAAVAVAIAAGG